MWIIFSAAGFLDDAMLLLPGDPYRNSIVFDREWIKYERGIWQNWGKDRPIGG